MMRSAQRPPVRVAWIVAVTVGVIAHAAVWAEEPRPLSVDGAIPQDVEQVYVSDYFSFVGHDEHGAVAFALDTNRGRDGDAYQAEHFAVLHDRQHGWVELHGNGRYENVGRQLAEIPASEVFQFSGTPRSGIVITSDRNEIVLEVSAVVPRRTRAHRDARFWVGSSSATLRWGARRIEGRVIYEYLMVPGFNRLTETSWDMWSEYQGLYVSLDGVGDLYVHQQEPSRLEPLVGGLDGFLAVRDQTEGLTVLQVTTLDARQAWGLYSWPTKWSVQWGTGHGGGAAMLELSELHRVANWFVGGFAMGIVTGTVTYAGQTYEVYGLAELLM